MRREVLAGLRSGRVIPDAPLQLDVALAAVPLRFEVRPNDDGTVDEVLIYDGERCVFHVEQLTDDRYYLNWYGDADRRYFHIHRKGKHVVITED